MTRPNPPRPPERRARLASARRPVQAAVPLLPAFVAGLSATLGPLHSHLGFAPFGLSPPPPSVDLNFIHPRIRHAAVDPLDSSPAFQRALDLWRI